jgi:hypothetical protein
MNTLTLTGFKPEFYVSEADAMSIAPFRHRQDTLSLRRIKFWRIC